MDLERTWVCNICGNINTYDENVCEQCGALKIESSYDVISDDEN